MRLLVPATLWLAGLAACGSKATSTTIKPPAASSDRAVADTPAAPVAVSPNVAVSDDVAQRCSLRFANVEQAPKFAYDTDVLLAEDREVLQQIAECLVRGPLQGRSVRLVGRTDSRGTEEYNLALGTRRADTVRSHLQRLGVPDDRLASTTRGEVDAHGSDESGWQRDRRVDLVLVN